MRSPLLSLFLLLILLALPARAQHVGLFLTADEAAAIGQAQGAYPLLDNALAEARATMHAAFTAPMDVPPPGEAGGYAHERHKQNYREMHAAGILYAITGEAHYAHFVRDMLEAYAAMYPDLGPHPLAYNQKPGKLFHQTLNEEVWLVHTAIAYDCVYGALTEEERARFEANIFRPMAEWFSVRNESEFNRIHNHGTWAVAAVGMIGMVMGETEWVEKALHGSKLDGAGGFLAQLDLLFSPDGYYMEGPYYIRYALMPFYYFGEALHRTRPDVDIYAYRNQILKKALYSAVETAFPNGVFPPINDASRTMDIAAPEVVLAVDLAYERYGANANLLGAAGIQNQVILNGAGLNVARAYAAAETPPAMSWPSIEFTDGYDGQQGGLGILRTGEGRDQTMLLMKYGVHGEGHGHFDKLHFIFFDQGREVVPDYGFSRWINIEPKYGGRYLPENKTYAMQTVAHNTVVVDGQTQNDADRHAAEAMSGQRHFFDASQPHVQVISAQADGYYEGVGMQRTMLLIDDARLDHPAIVDLYRLTSDAPHRYDYPLHFRGQLITTNLDYTAHTTALQPLGTDHGYQHLWAEAEARTDSTLRVTWLDGNRYYSLVTAGVPGTEVHLARTGANDPNFNLITEPMVLVRRTAADHLFASVIEPHGYFNEAQERSVHARGNIAQVRVLGHNDDGSVVEVTGKDGLHWRIMIANGPADVDATHRLTFGGQAYTWTGPYHVEGLTPRH